MHAFDRRTDVQTDRQTDGQTEFSSLARVCISCSAVEIRHVHHCTAISATVELFTLLVCHVYR